MALQRFYHPNGALRFEGDIVDGKARGISRTWHPNGQLATETPMRDGNAHGTRKQWAQDGRLLGTLVFFGSGTTTES
jgi:antitoxin component YwqK of YwqJK toxin-antitoxin module